MDVKALTHILKFDKWKNIFILISGNSVASFLPIIFSPLISRIYLPNDYGDLGFYLSVTGLIGILASSHYSQIAILVKTDDEALNGVWLSIYFAALISIITFSVIFVLDVKGEMNDVGALRFWLLISPAHILISSVGNSLNVWFNRFGKYTLITNARIVQSVIVVSCQILFGLLYEGNFGLMFSLIVGQFLITIYLFLFFVKESRSVPSFKSFNQLITLAKKHKSLFYFTLPGDFISNLALQLPVFILQKVSGSAIVGNFAFAQRMFVIPQQLVSSAFGEVFKKEALSEFHKNGNCGQSFVSFSKRLFLIGLVPFIIAITCGDLLFAYVFGEKWILAGEFAQVLSFMYLIRFVVSPLSYILILTGHNKLGLISILLLGSISSLILYIAINMQLGIKFSLFCFSLTYFILATLLYFVLYILANKNNSH